MAKKLLTVLLCLLLAAAVPLTAVAEEEDRTLTVSSAEDFLAFSENCRLDSYSINLQVTLTADIDLTGLNFQGIPIFSGSFDGGGHTISGLNITAQGSVLGLFRYLTDTAVIKDLQVAGTLQPQGSRGTVGGIAGSNAGTIEGCSFTGTVSGSDRVGGIAGINILTGIIEDCQVSGSVDGSHNVGGIVGENSGVIRLSTNSAQVNTTAQQNTVEISDITLDTLTGSEAANTVTDIGGIAGTSSGVIRSCENRGDVGYKHMGYNVGGIAGSQVGYITGCENYGAISGRKEVGGIVGHMEPVILVEYSEDTLQILQEQLDELGTLTGNATASAQGSAAAVNSQIAAMQQQTQDAREALEQLLPTVTDPETGEPGLVIPDADTIQAAQNALSGSITQMQGSLQSIAATSQNAVSALSGNMQAISSQVGKMSQTVSGASENLGGSVTDISDADTAEDLTAKVADCENYGAVLADLNAGGISGAIAIENDLDPEADLQIFGDSSLNFEGMLRAVILNCSNTGTVTAKKQNTGGIVGWMSMGLLKNGINKGAVEGADYTGGIAGSSSGYIRDCSAKCRITADSYVGGIAGTADTLTDCRSMVLLEAAEKKGAVVGYTENRESIAGNYYLAVEADPGAIDGISYDASAQSLGQEDFLALESLPKMFRKVTVQFLFEDGTAETVTLAPGEALREEDIPQIPEKEGYTAYWEGLEALDIAFDTIYTAVYSPLTAVLESEEQRESGLPVLLAEGTFAPDTAITVTALAQTPELSEKQQLLEALCITVPAAGAVTLRYLPPEPVDESAQLLILTDSGLWQEVIYTADGSYLVFEADSGELLLALVLENGPDIPWLLIAAIGAAVILITVGILVIRKRKIKSKPTKK